MSRWADQSCNEKDVGKPRQPARPDVGGDTSSPSFSDGHWCEFHLYDRVLTAPERAIVVGDEWALWIGDGVG